MTISFFRGKAFISVTALDQQGRYPTPSAGLLFVNLGPATIKEERQKNEVPEVRKDRCKTVSSEHAMSLILMNS